MTKRAHVWIGLALALCACRPSAPESLDHAHVELCCKTANPDNLSFSGCRAAPVSDARGRDGRGLMCRTRETIWVRGPVSCSAGECRLALEPEPTRPAAPAVARDVAAPEPKPAPAPAPIVPMPLESSERVGGP